MLRHTLVCHVSPTVHTMACVMLSLLYTIWHVSCHPYCTQYGMCHVIPTVHTMACHPYCTQYDVILTVHTMACHMSLYTI